MDLSRTHHTGWTAPRTTTHLKLAPSTSTGESVAPAPHPPPGRPTNICPDSTTHVFDQGKE